MPSEPDLVTLGTVAQAGVHPPEAMPFLHPWTDPSDTFVADFVEYHLGLRAAWQPSDWDLNFAVFAHGAVIGSQGLRGNDFAVARDVVSGSWLGQRFQGHGYGTEMRAAVLSLAFLGLGALSAHTAAMDFNLASQRVSEKLGYVRAGEQWPVVRGRPQRELVYVLDRATFLALDSRPAVEITGLEPCRHLFGLSS